MSSPSFLLAFAAFEHWLCCTSQERVSALDKSLKSEFPATWNWLPPVAVTGGGAMPPRVPVKVWRFVPELLLDWTVLLARRTHGMGKRPTVVAAAARAVGAGDETATSGSDPDADPAMILPWLSTAAIAPKFVMIPNTALNASACDPVLGGLESNATLAAAQVSSAVWSAPHVLTRVSHIN